MTPNAKSDDIMGNKAPEGSTRTRKNRYWASAVSRLRGAYPTSSTVTPAPGVIATKTFGSKQRSNSNKASLKSLGNRRSSLPERPVSHRKSDDSELHIDLSALSTPQLPIIPPSATRAISSPAAVRRVGSSPLPSHSKQSLETQKRPDDNAVSSEEQEKQWWEMMFDWDMWGSILENPFCQQQDAEGGSPPTAILEDKQHFDFASVFPFFSSPQQKNPDQVECEERGMGYRATTSGTLTFRRIDKPRPLTL